MLNRVNILLASLVMFHASTTVAQTKAVPASPSAVASNPVQVMVLGTYHFGNKGHNLIDAKVDSSISEQRQAELDAVARAIAAWKPTRVMVEQASDAVDFAVEKYTNFDLAQLSKEDDERTQIGYRIAKMSGIAAVNGIDEQPKDDEPDYFPYGKLQATAAKFGQTAIIDRCNAIVQAWSTSFESRLQNTSIADRLIEMNEPSLSYPAMTFYYDVLPIGDHDTQSGAELNAAWYLRNAKIFGKLMQVAKPGDRVLVVFGAGHGFWLRHFAKETPGYTSVDVKKFLLHAKAKKIKAPTASRHR
jgi:hypothetical protein